MTHSHTRDISEKQYIALIRVFNAIPNLTPYAILLGATALTVNAGLPGAQSFIIGAGINIFVQLLNRLVGGENVTPDEIEKQVQQAIQESNIIGIAHQNQHILAKLLQDTHILET